MTVPAASLTLPASAMLMLACALASFGLCRVLRPVFVRYALARPNARSSHKVPTPQGGGIPVIVAVLAGLVAAVALWPGEAPALRMLGLATIVIGALGALDDIRPLSALARLVVQAACVGLVVVSLPPLPISAGLLPGWLDRALIVLAGVWFVNLTNFMDGLDGITVAAFVPLGVAVAALAMLGAAPRPDVACVALALAGGLLGFLPFNRPVATLFLGDVGALAIGLIGAWLLYQVALQVGLVIAVALPLYHLADATLTLLRRLARGEKVWEAHRSHAYQQATDHGFTVAGVSTRVAAVNAIIGIAAVLAVASGSEVASFGVLALAAGLTGWLIHAFTRGEVRRP